MSCLEVCPDIHCTVYSIQTAISLPALLRSLSYRLAFPRSLYFTCPYPLLFRFLVCLWGWELRGRRIRSCCESFITNTTTETVVSLSLLHIHCKRGTCILNTSNTLLVLLGASDTYRSIYWKPTACQGTHSILEAEKCLIFSLGIASEGLSILIGRYVDTVAISDRFLYTWCPLFRRRCKQ